MYFLIYRSEATITMDEGTLTLLLAQSRDRNKKMGITGMLLFFGNSFMQLLEGEENDVKLLYRDICADSRHTRLTILKEGAATKRLFPDWSMSFRSAAMDDIVKEPAYKDIYRPGSSGALDLVSLVNLLRGKPGK